MTLVKASKPTKAPDASLIHPMLAESINEPFDGEDWLFEIKWDGYRAIAFHRKRQGAAGLAESE